MIFEHQYFFLNCIPKTGSKSTSFWCETNGMVKVNKINFDKPVFATIRNQKDRIISGIFEDIFHLTLTTYNLTGLEPFNDVEHLYKKTIDNWALNCSINVLPHQCHYANLEAYFLASESDLSKIHWIHMDDLVDIDRIINKVLGFDLKLKPFMKENFRFDYRRPPKEWFYEIIKNMPQASEWIETRISQSYCPTCVKL